MGNLQTHLLKYTTLLLPIFLFSFHFPLTQSLQHMEKEKQLTKHVPIILSHHSKIGICYFLMDKATVTRQ